MQTESRDQSYLRMLFQRGGDQRWRLDEIAQIAGMRHVGSGGVGCVRYADNYHEVRVDFTHVPPKVTVRELLNGEDEHCADRAAPTSRGA